MNNLYISPIDISYLEDVLTINNLCFSDPWSMDTLKKETENKFSKYIVVKKDDTIIGYAGIWLILDEAHITSIAVHPNYQGLGGGNILIDEILSICKDRCIPSITLEVRSNNNKAINLYTKYGFLKEGLRKNYYGENLDGIIMWKRDII